MSTYNIMIIDDEYSDRSSLYHDFFQKEYSEVSVSFHLHSIEYGRDIFAKLLDYAHNIDAFFY